MDTKRAYKLQEFVAHSADVNCAKFGKQTSRILVTGGEDHKVNLWAIGKPSSILSLSGLTSPIESVSFDSTEVMIGAGAASGTIKIWDIEEAKVVRTFTGHRSNCGSLDFHPFGEFFASGSSDTNMKIWDMRKKRCIHTYKGHTRRIDVLRFTPDGRWIVSGGADSSVKIWDLTAGKLLHDFSLHEDPVNCLAFHPHEFLLATGSSDKTVKFWDLETFELVGSSEPENCREYFVPASVVRSMTFNSDGKTLLCGLHENLKVLSWEPIICHDVVDVSWSTLADLTVQEGKLLGCSFNQSCVGIWVVDIMKIEPYAVNNTESYLNESVNRPTQADDSISSVFGRLSVSRSPATDEISSNNLLKRPLSSSKEIHVPASSAVMKRLSKAPRTGDFRFTRANYVPLLPPRIGGNTNRTVDQNNHPANVMTLAEPNVRSKVALSTNPRIHNSQSSADPKNRPRTNKSTYNSKGPSCLPVIVPTNSSKVDPGPGSNFSKVTTIGLPTAEPPNIVKDHLAMHHGNQDGFDAESGSRKISNDVIHKIMPETSSKINPDIDFRRKAPEIESEKVQQSVFQSKTISLKKKKTVRENSYDGDICCFGPVCTENVESNRVGNRYSVCGFGKTKSAVGRDPEYDKVNRRAVSQLMESIESNTAEHGPSCANYKRSQYAPILDGWSVPASDEDAIADIMENHQEFIHGLKSRLTKLEVVYRCWQNKDMEVSVDATRRMLDHAVTADIVSVLMDNTTKCITLDICTYLLPLASSLLDSRYDRHLNIALQMILKLVKSFGATISSTLSAAPPIGVDIVTEQRLERCNSCFQELKRVDAILITLTRRQGEVGRLAHELSLFLQGILQLTSSVCV